MNPFQSQSFIGQPAMSGGGGAPQQGQLMSALQQAGIPPQVLQRWAQQMGTMPPQAQAQFMQQQLLGIPGLRERLQGYMQPQNQNVSMQQTAGAPNAMGARPPLTPMGGAPQTGAPAPPQAMGTGTTAAPAPGSPQKDPAALIPPQPPGPLPPVNQMTPLQPSGATPQPGLATTANPNPQPQQVLVGANGQPITPSAAPLTRKGASTATGQPMARSSMQPDSLGPGMSGGKPQQNNGVGGGVGGGRTGNRGRRRRGGAAVTPPASAGPANWMALDQARGQQIYGGTGTDAEKNAQAAAYFAQGVNRFGPPPGQPQAAPVPGIQAALDGIQGTPSPRALARQGGGGAARSTRGGGLANRYSR